MLFDEQGRITGAIESIRDITEQKEAETLLRSKNTELIEKDRAIQEANNTLEKMNADLVALNSIKDNFLSSVSHELRTPLTCIKAYSQLLEDSSLGPVNTDQKEALGVMLTSVENLNTLINNLLDVGRYEAKKSTFHLSIVKVNELLTTVLKEFEPMMTQIGGTITLDAPENELLITADNEKLGQVIRNLVGNAIKYRSGAPLRLTIRVRSKKAQLTLVVKDNGIGIAKKNLKNLFNKFYQVDQGMTRKTEGTGLGLSITKHIVEGHGGTITVASRLGAGTTFTIVLPKTPPENASPQTRL